MKHALLLLSLIATQAQAQIIYTDVIPDATYNVSGDTCHLDLDNNGQADYRLCQFVLPYYCDTCLMTSPESSVMVFRVGTNVIADTTLVSFHFPQCYQSGQVIGASLTYSVTNGMLRDAAPGGGCGGLGSFCIPLGWLGLPWANFPEGYLGLRFKIAGVIHYGWARLSAPSASEFTLKDYAYNSVPGAAILAGDDGSSSGIASTALRGMQVAPNPFSSTLSISLPTGTTGPVSCRVLSLVGQALLTRTVAATNGPSSIALDLGSLAPGTYLLEMQLDGERIVRKVVKE